MNEKTPPGIPGRKGHAPLAGVSWEKLRAVFSAAIELPPGERRAWLARQEGVDDALRREVASLLEAHEHAGGFLNPDTTRRTEDL